MISTARAWLLDFGKGLQAAVGLHEMSQVMLSVDLLAVPCTPVYCSEVFIFQNRILPALDVAGLLEGQKIYRSEQNVIGIAIYQKSPTESVRYGGLHLATLPLSIFVDNEQACDLPAHQQYWSPFAISCFSRNEVAIPILDLTRLFTTEMKAV